MECIQGPFRGLIASLESLSFPGCKHHTSITASLSHISRMIHSSSSSPSKTGSRIFHGKCHAWGCSSGNGIWRPAEYHAPRTPGEVSSVTEIVPITPQATRLSLLSWFIAKENKALCNNGACNKRLNQYRMRARGG
jgi:hypothetical protein